METIRIYLENMFSRLPKTPQIIRLENDMLRTMEDKYEELKSQGKSENEAIGIVISEFGNIDELLAELDLQTPDPGSSEAGRTNDASEQDGLHSSSGSFSDPLGTGFRTLYLDQEQSEQFIRDRIRISRITAFGISLFLLGPALSFLAGGLLLSSGILQKPGFSQPAFLLMLLPLALCLILGLILTIYGSSLSAQYRSLKETELLISPSLREHIRGLQEEFRPQYAVMTALSILLVFFSPASLLFFLLADRYDTSGGNGLGVYEGLTGAFFLLLFLAIALYLFLTAHGQKRAYTLLLREEGRDGRQEGSLRTEGILRGILSAYWPLVFCVYFLISFYLGIWAVSWLIYWPIAPAVQRLLYARLHRMEKSRNQNEGNQE